MTDQEVRDAIEREISEAQRQSNISKHHITKQEYDIQRSKLETQAWTLRMIIPIAPANERWRLEDELRLVTKAHEGLEQAMRTA